MYWFRRAGIAYTAVVVSIPLLLTSAQAYDPVTFRETFDNIRMEGRTLENVEADLKPECGREGIILTVVKPSRVHGGGPSARLDAKRLTCQSGGANRLEQYVRSLDHGKPVLASGHCGLRGWKVAQTFIRLHVRRFRHAESGTIRWGTKIQSIQSMILTLLALPPCVVPFRPSYAQSLASPAGIAPAA